MSAQITLDLSQLNQRLDALASIPDNSALLQSLAVEGESQTRRRLSTEKQAPDGSVWPAWSEPYAATRHGGHSLLEGEGDLIDSMQSDIEGNGAVWGSPLAYAARQNFGDDGIGGIPQREFLGLSTANKHEMMAIMNDFIQSAWQ